MASDHPFQMLFESFGRLPSSHSDLVNRSAYEELTSVLQVPLESAGRCILLRAPRAGHGKTHLLSRVQHFLAGNHEFIPLHLTGSRIDALSVTEDALKRLTRALPAGGGLSVLDLVARKLFAYSLQPLVISGEVPCQDREGALSALKTRPVETFDFHHPNAVTAHWARENFEVLGPRLSMELAQRAEVAVREVSFWVTALFRYAATPVDHPGRAGALGLEVAGQVVSDNVAMDRLSALLALVSLLHRVVLVADDLEGFSADESAALRFAAFVGSVRQSAERVDVILSLNKDVWDNAFVPRLSGGLADRLSEVLIELEPLTEEEIVALFDSRAPGLGKEVLERVDSDERHARGLIRAAGIAWVTAANERSSARSLVDAVEPAEQEELEEQPAAKMEAGLEVEAAQDLVDSALPEETSAAADQEAAAPAETFPTTDVEPADDAFTFGNEEPASSPGASIFEAAPTFSPGEPVVHSEPVPPVFQPVAEPEASPAAESVFQPVFQPVREEAPAQAFQPAEPEQAASIFQAVQETQDPSVFQAVHEEAAPPVFQPYANEEPTPPAPAAAFEPVQPSSEFGPPKFTPPGEAPQEPNEEMDRVDDLLRQFRERYGR